MTDVDWNDRTAIETALAAAGQNDVKTAVQEKMQVALSQLTEDLGKDLFAGKPMTITRPKPQTVLEQVSLELAVAALSEELNQTLALRWADIGT